MTINNGPSQTGISADHGLPETGFLRLAQIIGDPKRGITPIIPICKSNWWAGVKTGRYPKSVKLGPRTTAWRVEDIRELINRMSQDSANSVDRN